MSVIIKSSTEQTVLESSSLIYGHPVRRDSHWSVSCDAPGSRAADDPAARRREGLGPPCAAPHTARTLGHDAVARECSGPLRGQKAETTSKRTVSTPTVRCTLIPHPRKAQLHLRASPSPQPASSRARLHPLSTLHLPTPAGGAVDLLLALLLGCSGSVLKSRLLALVT